MINFSKNIILGGYNICKKYNYQQVCADLISESNFQYSTFTDI